MSANRLANETSPYLLQHAHNPVDWYPWGDDAFARARAEDKPLLLSVGYSACHWCHVMERESFENADIAAVMNRHFVSVKVDREERPDVDQIYMEAVQAMTGHGGWPMTVFLTPEGVPFYGGTYFPPTARHGLPSFRQVLAAITDAWTNRRGDVVASARALPARLAGVRGRGVSPDRGRDAGLPAPRHARSGRRVLLGRGRRLRGARGEVLRVDRRRDPRRARTRRRGAGTRVLGGGSR